MQKAVSHIGGFKFENSVLNNKILILEYFKSLKFSTTVRQMWVCWWAGNQQALSLCDLKKFMFHFPTKMKTFNLFVVFFSFKEDL